MPDNSRRLQNWLSGIGLASAAFIWWGLAPVYWKAFPNFSAPELLCQRVFWSFVFCSPFLFTLRFRTTLLDIRKAGRRKILPVILSAYLIGFNWFLYMVAMTQNQVLEASLGYFLTPLMSVVLGLVLLREHLTRLQWVAFALAVVAVLYLSQGMRGVPWLAISLATSFGFYGYFKAVLRIPGPLAITVESILLFPAAVFLMWKLSPSHTWQEWLWLTTTGPFTVIPLFWYASATQKVSYSTVGFLQYIAPFLQFSLAVILFQEPYGATQRVAFALIWVALSIFTLDLWRRARIQAERSG